MFKFLNYNVNGIGSKLGNPDFIQCINQYSVVCLTETFMSTEIDISTFPHHMVYSVPAKTRTVFRRRDCPCKKMYRLLCNKNPSQYQQHSSAKD